MFVSEQPCPENQASFNPFGLSFSVNNILIQVRGNSYIKVFWICTEKLALLYIYKNNAWPCVGSCSDYKYIKK